MPRWIGLPVLGLLCLLSACAQPTPSVAEPLDFDTDPRILRGVWTGTDTDGTQLLLDLNASDPTADGYAVTGTFQLGDTEPVVIEGQSSTAVAASAGTLGTQTDLPSSTFTAVSVVPGWRLEGSTPAGSPPGFVLDLSGPPGVDDVFTTFSLSAQPQTVLVGTEWSLETLQGEAPIEGSDVTLTFGERPHEGFSGNSGCNLYGARYLASDTTFEIVYGILSTDMLCDTPTGLMDQEEAYLTALSQATTYRLEGERLELGDADGTVTLLFSSQRSAPERQGEPVQTDALVYVLSYQGGIYDATAVATYTNETDETVYFNRCSFGDEEPVHFVTRASPDENKSSVVGAAWGCGGGVPRGEVSPGETLSAEVWLGSTESPDAQPPVQPEERVGRFRVLFELFAESGTNDDLGDPLSLAARHSNAFDIRFAEQGDR